LDPRTLDEKSDVSVSVDGRNYTVKAGSVISLRITSFWKNEAVSLHIEEDEKPLHILVGDY
jgi:D-lyxose ketol-isomerase